jgi:hypothetical protein
MTILARIVVGLVLAGAAATVALAQPPGLPVPELQNRIPAPLSPPPQPPIINGPLSQAPPPGVYIPPSLNTPADRVVACLHAGSAHGLRGGKLDRYTRRCVNAN